MEEWKDIEGYEGIYQVSSLGRVRNANQFMKSHPLPNGYLVVRLRAPGKKRSNSYLHRLVAKAFIPNPENLPEVNHDDGNKADCSKGNLFWTDRSGNNAHKNRVLFSHHNQTDFSFLSPDGERHETANLAAFCEKHNLTRSAMSRVASGHRSKHKGWTK